MKSTHLALATLMTATLGLYGCASTDDLGFEDIEGIELSDYLDELEEQPGFADDDDISEEDLDDLLADTDSEGEDDTAWMGRLPGDGESDRVIVDTTQKRSLAKASR